VSIFLNIVGYLLEIAFVASFLYGTWCALQAWMHRIPQRNRHQKLFPIDDHLDPVGRRNLRTAFKAWGVAIGVILLATLVF
jgi:hypothetical protein